MGKQGCIGCVKITKPCCDSIPTASLSTQTNSLPFSVVVNQIWSVNTDLHANIITLPKGTMLESMWCIIGKLALENRIKLVTVKWLHERNNLIAIPLVCRMIPDKDGKYVGSRDVEYVEGLLTKIPQ